MRLFKKLLIGAAAAISFVAVSAPLAHADDSTAVTVEGSTITFSETGWTLLTQAVLPVVIGLLLKSSASARVKAVVVAVSSLIAAIVAQRVLLPDGTAFLTVDLAFDAFVVWLGSQVWYNRLYSQFDLNDKLLPSKGIG